MLVFSPTVVINAIKICLVVLVLSSKTFILFAKFFAVCLSILKDCVEYFISQIVSALSSRSNNKSICAPFFVFFLIFGFLQLIA
jgi:hypothetical protein